MFVLKFGGTSVGSAASIKKVAEILKGQSSAKPVFTVVSAFGGITNHLQKAAETAASGNDSYTEELISIEERHLSVINELLSLNNRNAVLTRIKLMLNELESLLRGVFLIQELSHRSLDRILSYGELMSSVIIHAYLEDQGLDAAYIDSRDIIKTDRSYGNASVQMNESFDLIRNTQQQHSGKSIFICAGFVASSSDEGHTTTLGRGGSDYTAALIAAALKADELQVWTDVSGMMTSDPRMVPNAHPIPYLSYEEAMELSHFGAKVIYPPTIQPAMDENIPIHIKNTFAPDDHGSVIQAENPEGESPVKGTSSIRNVALLTLSGSGMVAVPNISHRLFGSLSREQINVIMITQASSEHTITVCISEEVAERAKDAVLNEFAYEIERHKINEPEIEQNLAILALVGSRMKRQVGISARLFDTLSHNGVNIRAIAQGSTELNISVVIDDSDLKKSLNSVHESFFLSDHKRLSLFMIGVGNVGKVFLEQVKSQQDYLRDNHHLDLEVCGLANSRQMLFNEDGIALDDWEKQLSENHEPMDLNVWLQRMREMNLRNSILIDCTASDSVPGIYSEALEHSISVVTPNKIAASSSYDHFRKLTNSALKYKSRFLYETNVGAGLPVISTLNDLIKSGDRIHRIEAVLSGTLNYIFNHYDGRKSFSSVVQDAEAGGYTEPDPKIDLSGIDVMRKILILARVSGTPLELPDITCNSFVPESCMEAGNKGAFYRALEEQEEHFKALYREAEDEGKRIKYVATFEGSEAETGLKTFGPEHPFYNLGGKDNIVLFYTNRYSEQPLVIKGAGAGAAVTASGIFADVMKIASS